MRRIFVSTLLALALPPATAQPVRCVDASGKVRYVDASQAGNDKCTSVGNRLEIVPAPPAGPPVSAPAATSGGDDRVKDAEKRLAEAKQKLAEQEAVRQGDERNYQRVLDRLKPYQDAVESAQKDLDQARRDAR